MRAITLWQPWATLVAIGAKRIETRSWTTSYRGPLAIHAAATMPPEGRDAVCREPFVKALADAGINPFAGKRIGDDLPRGVIVATCELADCIEIEHGTLWPDGWMTDARIPPPEPEHSFGDYRAGRFAWLLTDVRVLTPPVPAKGKQALWEWDDAVVGVAPAADREVTR